MTMARMTDSDYAQATKMGRALYQFLSDHGEDGDGFSNLFSSLDSLFGPRRGLVALGRRRDVDFLNEGE
jgi:hypothetical protein